MNLQGWFHRFGLGKVRLGPSWANVELSIKDDDRDAAWELYIGFC